MNIRKSLKKTAQWNPKSKRTSTKCCWCRLRQQRQWVVLNRIQKWTYKEYFEVYSQEDVKLCLANRLFVFHLIWADIRWKRHLEICRENITFITVVSSEKNENLEETIGATWEKDGPFYTPLKFMKYKGYYFKDVYVLTEKGLRFFIESFE